MGSPPSKGILQFDARRITHLLPHRPFTNSASCLGPGGGAAAAPPTRLPAVARCSTSSGASRAVLTPSASPEGVRSMSASLGLAHAPVTVREPCGGVTARV